MYYAFAPITGIIWGITNVLIENVMAADDRIDNEKGVEPTIKFRERVKKTVNTLRKPAVYMPYIVNQFGSCLFYYSLGAVGTLISRYQLRRTSSALNMLPGLNKC